METRLIHDDAGEWLVNTGNFQFTDPETGCVFKPRTPTKAVYSGWAKSQPVIQAFVVEEEMAPLATASVQLLATSDLQELATAAVTGLTTEQVGALTSVPLPAKTK